MTLLEDAAVVEATTTNLIENTAEAILNDIITEWREAYDPAEAAGHLGLYYCGSGQ